MSKTINAFTSTINEESTSIIFSVPELAEYLGIGRNRAYDLLRNNIIKGFRIGTTWRVSKIAVDQYILKSSGII